MKQSKSIILANPPLPHRDGRPMVPLGLDSLHASLIAAGYENVHVVDAGRDRLPDVEAMVRRIRELVGDRLDFIGIGVLPAVVVATNELIGRVREEFGDAPEVCVGGYFPTSLGGQALQHFSEDKMPDYLVRGRGEGALLDILEHGKTQAIPNVITTLPDWEILDGGRAPVDISNLAWPTREDLAAGGHVAINRLLGCPGACTFCTVHRYAHDNTGSIIIQRTVTDFVAEMSSLHHESGITGFDIVDDDAFGDNPDEWHEILDEMDRHELKGKIRFWLLTRIEAVANNPELIARMAEYGLTSVYCGLESLTERQLKLYAKMASRTSIVDYPTFLEQAAASLRILTDNGVIPKYGFIPFDADVTPDEIRENIRLAQELGLFYYVAELTKRLAIYEGSSLQRLYRRKGYLTEAADRDDEKWVVQRYSYEFQHPVIARLRPFLDTWTTRTFQARLFTQGVSRDRYKDPESQSSQAAWELYKSLRDIEIVMLEEIMSLAEADETYTQIQSRLNYWIEEYNSIPNRFF